MNEMNFFARFTSSWTEWPNKWDTGRALTYRSQQSWESLARIIGLMMIASCVS